MSNLLLYTFLTIPNQKLSITDLLMRDFSRYFPFLKTVKRRSCTILSISHVLSDVAMSDDLCKYLYVQGVQNAKG